MTLLSKILTPILVLVFLSLVMRVARKPPQLDASGAAVLTIGWPLRLLGLVSIGFAAMIIGILLVKAPQAPGEWGAAAALIGFFGLGGAYFLLESFASRLVVCERGLRSRSPWRQERSFAWSEIAQVTFSKMYNGFVIVGPQGQKIRASAALTGIRVLASALQQHLSVDRYAQAANVVEAMACVLTHEQQVIQAARHGQQPTIPLPARVAIPQAETPAGAALTGNPYASPAGGPIQRSLVSARCSLPSLQLTVVGLSILVMGCLFAATIARLLGWQRPATEVASVLRWAVIVSAPITFLLSRRMAESMVKSGRHELAAANLGDKSETALSERLLGIYRSQLMSSATMLVGAALACVAAFFVVGSAASFAMAFVFAFAILLLFPSTGRVARWIDEQLELLDQDRVALRTGRLARR